MDAAKAARTNSTMKTRVGASLVRGGRIMGVASNRMGATPSSSVWSRHAEVGVTMNKDAYGADVYVYREHGLHGTPMLAKPCSACREWLKDVGVRRVYYTTPQGYHMEKL